MGRSSDGKRVASRRSVNSHRRRSNPYSVMYPFVYTGAGRTYASAARYPGALVSSGGFRLDRSDEIEGFVNVRFRFPGVTVVPSSTSLRGVPVPAADGDVVSGVGGGSAVTGSVWSSTEKMDRSSPFHWSPRWWSFCGFH